MSDVSYPAELTPFANEVNFGKIHEVPATSTSTGIRRRGGGGCLWRIGVEQSAITYGACLQDERRKLSGRIKSAEEAVADGKNKVIHEKKDLCHEISG